MYENKTRFACKAHAGWSADAGAQKRLLSLACHSIGSNGMKHFIPAAAWPSAAGPPAAFYERNTTTEWEKERKEKAQGTTLFYYYFFKMYIYICIHGAVCVYKRRTLVKKKLQGRHLSEFSVDNGRLSLSLSLTHLTLFLALPFSLESERVVFCCEDVSGRLVFQSGYFQLRGERKVSLWQWRTGSVARRLRLPGQKGDPFLPSRRSPGPRVESTISHCFFLSVSRSFGASSRRIAAAKGAEGPASVGGERVFRVDS